MDNYDTILDRMKEKYKELSGNDVPELSDIDIRMKVLAGEIFNNEVNLDFAKRQLYPTTAIGEYLELHAADRGLSRKTAVKARGRVRFCVNAALSNNITIPRGTVVSTSGSGAVRFLTDNDAVLTAGNLFVGVDCTAEQAGLKGNVLANTINVMVTNIVGIDSVTNLDRFSQGAEEETDEQLRARVLESFKYTPNGANKAYYKKLATSVNNVWSANVCPRVRGKGTVDVYINCERAVAPISLVNEVQTIMNSKRELNVDVTVYAAEVDRITTGVLVTMKEGYELTGVTANIVDSVNSYLDSLSVGESVYEAFLAGAIMRAEGVESFRWDPLYDSQFIISADTFATLDTIHVSEDNG